MIDVVARDKLALPDGRNLEFEIRASTRTRSLRLKLSAREGLVVTAPLGLDRQRLLALVAGKAEWIAGRMAEFDAVRHLIGTQPVARPQAFDLPALAESWRVEYKATRSRTVGARVDQPGRIVVAGAVDDVEACHAALRRWLARHATSALSPWLTNLAEQTGLRFVDLAIKNQRTRWGSCSAHGRISLNCKLLFLPRELVRYVLLHEICHLLEANHSERFWMHLRHFEPSSDSLHGRMRDAWKAVPLWAQSGTDFLL
ncbi:MAG: SprT family zinc-dependent metalloprotease [Pseudomonadota bacterium]|nr:SprT family zinc-dependent metalloprotease [Pseudomonadota bacterium]MDP1903654.1 SprT family zinc-dependent metalloprotease [Pseudomonadota bacterium]MDP2352822.1 SprT family zinc-dependent metalloprotease [Pseudomonadota bacterium]